MLPIHLQAGTVQIVVTDSERRCGCCVVPTPLLRNVTFVDDSLSAPCKGGKKLVLLQDVVGVAGYGPVDRFPRLLPSRVPKSTLRSTTEGQNRGHCFNG